jgi:hypothetical protein
MPRIDNDIKLDFKDVLIRPKRSTLKSRADVDLTRQFIFRHSKKTYDGIPIIASNMDTVGTFEMAIQLSKVILGFKTVVYPGRMALPDKGKKANLEIRGSHWITGRAHRVPV